MCTFSYAHQGKTDEYGGHYNRSIGTYHYHSGEYAGTGEYTAPIEEGGTLIVEEDNSQSETDTLTVENNNDYLISSQQDKIDNLEQQIYAKEDSIGNLTEQLNEKNEKIEELESNQNSLFIGFAITLIIAIYIAYSIGAEKFKK